MSKILFNVKGCFPIERYENIIIARNQSDDAVRIFRSYFAQPARETAFEEIKLPKLDEGIWLHYSVIKNEEGEWKGILLREATSQCMCYIVIGFYINVFFHNSRTIFDEIDYEQEEGILKVYYQETTFKRITLCTDLFGNELYESAKASSSSLELFATIYDGFGHIDYQGRCTKISHLGFSDKEKKRYSIAVETETDGVLMFDYYLNQT